MFVKSNGPHGVAHANVLHGRVNSTAQAPPPLLRKLSRSTLVAEFRRGNCLAKLSYASFRRIIATELV
eukprot:5489374-Amphidinium_carterae.1